MDNTHLYDLLEVSESYGMTTIKQLKVFMMLVNNKAVNFTIKLLTIQVIK